MNLSQGKSLSVICSVLQWLKDAEAKDVDGSSAGNYGALRCVPLRCVPLRCVALRAVRMFVAALSRGAVLSKISVENRAGTTVYVLRLRRPSSTGALTKRRVPATLSLFRYAPPGPPSEACPPEPDVYGQEGHESPSHLCGSSVPKQHVLLLDYSGASPTTAG